MIKKVYIMNNFVFGSDPLLYSHLTPNKSPEIDFKTQLDNMMTQYRVMQQSYEDNNKIRDYIGELDNIIKNLQPELIECLNNNEEYIGINIYIQSRIQEELMNNVKWILNKDKDIERKVERAKEIINDISKEKENIDRQNLSDLNDYIKNYSDMTFNEYKQMKSKES